MMDSRNMLGGGDNMSGPVVGIYTPNRRKAGVSRTKDGAKQATNRRPGGGKGITGKKK